MKILFIDTVHPLLINELRASGHDCVEGYELTYEQIKANISEFDGLVIRSRVQLDRKMLEHSKLKFIARAGAGMESIDVDFARRKNIKCINSPEGNRNAVAEHALGMLLMLMNNLGRANNQVREGKWLREPNRGHELRGLTVGIIGFGNMGSAFAEILSGFGIRILAFDKYKSGFGTETIKEATLVEVMNEADVLSIHVPLTSETEYLVNDEFINSCRKNFYFINTARGKCVRTDDLVRHLRSGKIMGACLDVIEYEDLSFEKFSLKSYLDNPSWLYLTNSNKVILTPHIAGWSFESHERISKVLFEKITTLGRGI